MRLRRFGRSLLLFLAGAAVCSGFAARAEAAAPAAASERRARNRPILRVRSDYPTALIWQLKFAKGRDGGLRLYSAGEDKVVRSWKVADAAGGSAGLQPAGVVKWPIYRDVRGRIYALDVAGDRVAVGGIGVKTSQVSLVATGDEDRSAVLVDPRLQRTVVFSLCFSPDGRWLLVGEDGQENQPRAHLLVWDVERRPPRLAARVETNLRKVRHLAVNPAGTHVAAAGPAVAAGRSMIQLWKLPVKGGDAPILSQNIESGYASTLRGMAWEDDRTWIAGSFLGTLRGGVRGLRGSNPFEGNLFGKGFRLAKSGGEGPCVLVNAGSLPIRYQVARPTVDGQGRFEPVAESRWSGTRALAPQERKTFSGDYLAVRGFYRGRALESVNYLAGDYRLLHFENIVSALDSRGGTTALGLDHEGEGRVVVRRGTSNGELTGPRPFLEVTAVAVSPQGRYVAAAGVAREGPNGEQPVWQIRLWDAATRRLLAQVPDPASGEGNRLPIGGPIANIGIFSARIGERTVETVRFARGYGFDPRRRLTHEFRPLDRGFDVQKVNGRGEKRWKWLRPQLKKFDRQVAVVTADTAEIKVGRTVIASARRGDTLRVLDEQDGWHQVPAAGRKGWIRNSQVRIEKRPKFDFVLVDADGGTIGPLPLYPADERPRCGVRFEKTINGSRRQLAAVGLLNAIEIWDIDALRRGAGRRALLRRFYGHDSQVSCMDVSARAEWLVSGAMDGTISAWSLKDLGAGELGVRFRQLAGGRLVVGQVRDGSPGWEAGYEPGQEIVDVQVKGLRVSRSRWKAALQNAVPGEELFVQVKAGSDTFALMTPVAVDPLWTFYPQYDGYWTMWTPAGYFDEKRPRFGQLHAAASRFDWHINPGEATVSEAGVVTMAGIDFQKTYHQPRKLDEVHKTRQPAVDDLPLRPSLFLQRNGREVTFRVQANGRGDRIVEREVWLNGRQLPLSGDRAVLDTADFRQGLNTLVGIATIDRGTEPGRVAPATFRCRRQFTHRAENPAKPRLHYVGFGVTELDEDNREAIRAGAGSLRYTANDVDSVGEALAAAARATARRASTPATGSSRRALEGYDFRDFDKGTIALLADLKPDRRAAWESRSAFVSPPTKGALLNRLDQLAEHAGPDDLAVIMLAAHGVVDSDGSNFRVIGRDQPITPEELHDRLSKLRCRTLLVLATCHSQGAAIQRQLDDFSRVLSGPVILTACGRDQQDHELSQDKHGVFTMALLEALTAKQLLPEKGPLPAATLDTGGDGLISVEEVCRYVQRRTGEIIRARRVADAVQNPQLLVSATFRDSDRFPIRTLP